MLVYIIILGLIVAVVVLAYRLYMTKAYYKYDKDRLNKAEEDWMLSPVFLFLYSYMFTLSVGLNLGV